MSLQAIRRRLDRIEAARTPPQRVVTVVGRSEAEHQAKIAELIAAGAAAKHDLFVCIRKFADR